MPGGTGGKEPACQCRRHKRCGFEPWVRKIPWKRKRQPTPVFLPGTIPCTEEPGRATLPGVQTRNFPRQEYWSGLPVESISLTLKSEFLILCGTVHLDNPSLLCPLQPCNPTPHTKFLPMSLTELKIHQHIHSWSRFLCSHTHSPLTLSFASLRGSMHFPCIFLL